MDGREVVRRTLEFECPERVAHSFPPSDFVRAGLDIINPEGLWRRVDEARWQRVDLWGNTWERVDDTSMGEVVRGALEDLNDVKTLPLPDLSNPTYYAKASKLFASQPSCWSVGHVHGFTFSIARKLRRMEQYLADVLLERDKIEILHDRIDALIEVQIRRMREAGADSIMFAEDWGTQTQTLISPGLWRGMFKPRFAHLCSYAHSLGLKVFMHSCGKVTAIIPDLIQAGVDLLQFDQPRVHGLDTLAEMQDLGKVTFWCPVDIQATLPTKNPSLIRQEAGELLKKLWRGRGGFIAGYYSDQPSLGLEPKWQQIACVEFLRKGKRNLF